MRSKIDQRLAEVIAAILAHNGAVLDPDEEDGSLEVLSPPAVCELLKIPEYTRLCFSYNEENNDTIYASYDSEFFISLGKLFSGRGRFSRTGYPPHIPTREKLARLISKKIAFNNATFRLGKSEVKNISYLLFYFRYVALSDEKREGLLSLLINEANLSTLPFEDGPSQLREREDKLKDREKQEIKKVFPAAYSVGMSLAKERLGDFIKSLERRLNRDIRRVYEYYDTLKKETEKALKKKALAQAMSELNLEPTIPGPVNEDDREALAGRQQDLDSRIEKQITERTARGEGLDKLFNKLDLIEAERKWKVQDLVAKYALTIKIEPVSTIRIDTRSLMLWIDIRRRLSSRQFPLTFNPITKQLDALPCESCFNPQKSHYVCDDKLHIICSDCFKTCPDCGKRYCSACFNGCPKCRKRRDVDA